MGRGGGGVSRRGLPGWRLHLKYVRCEQLVGAARRPPATPKSARLSSRDKSVGKSCWGRAERQKWGLASGLGLS